MSRMIVQVDPRTQSIVAAVASVLGHDSEVVLVGGSVRDCLLGMVPKEYVFSTRLHPDEVE
jgi:tRNA nucleotidyltransferase/poly(A) polymerase